MKGYWSWEGQDEEDVPFQDLKPLEVPPPPEYKGRESAGGMAQSQAMPSVGGMPQQTGPGGPGIGDYLKKGLDIIEKGKEIYDKLNPPEEPYIEQQLDTKADPFNPNNYEYNPDNSEWERVGSDPFDPDNYEIGGDGALSFVGESPFSSDQYDGMLYDDSNPFDLSDREWVEHMGALGSGSLVDSTLSNVSDMGGVADEIVSQAGGMEGVLGNGLEMFRQYAPLVGLGLKIFQAGKEGFHGTDLAQIAASSAPAMISALGGTAVMSGYAAIPGLLFAGSQMIAQNRNKPSRRYFDPYDIQDLGGGRYLQLGMKHEGSGDYSDLSDSSQSIMGGIAGETGKHSTMAYMFDSNTNSHYYIPMGDLIPDDMKHYIPPEELANEEMMAQIGMGGDDPTDYGRRFTDETGTYYLTPGEDSYGLMAEHAKTLDYSKYEPVELGMFKDTIVTDQRIRLDSLNAGIDKFLKDPRNQPGNMTWAEPESDPYDDPSYI